MLLLNHPELLQFIFFQEIFHKNSQSIHLYCFSQYQKYFSNIIILIVDLSTWNECWKERNDRFDKLTMNILNTYVHKEQQRHQIM